MRKISLFQIMVFFLISTVSAVMSYFTTLALFKNLPLGDFRGIALLAISTFFLYGYIITFHRLLLKILPIKAGEIKKGSIEEFSYHIYLMFYLIYFYPIIRSSFLPLPLMRVFYQILGTRMGDNTYSSGLILDPSFVELGENTLVGQYALIVPHVIENDKLAHYPVKIGSNVTIGAQSIIMSDVTIGDGALVAMGAVVKKGTQIGAGEVWGGIPAKQLKISEQTLAKKQATQDSINQKQYELNPFIKEPKNA